MKVEGANGVNRNGVGARVIVYSTTARALLGAREIQVGYGWCSGEEAVAHFGLGKEETVNVEVVLPHGKGKIMRDRVKANQRVTVKP